MTVDYYILVHLPHTDFGFTDTVFHWSSFYLTNGAQYISRLDYLSTSVPVNSGVLQDSFRYSILFSTYIKPLSTIIDSHSIMHHAYFNCRYLLLLTNYRSYSMSMIHSMQSCICDINAWKIAIMLKSDDNKTDLMLITSRWAKRLYSLFTSIAIGNAQMPFK